MLGTALGAAGDIAGGILGGVGGIMNAIQRKKEFEYQKQLQQQIFEREDTAAQRKATDLAKAGLSKTLAAGGGAQAGAVVQTQAPTMDIPAPDASGTMAGMKLDSELSAMKEREKLVQQQVKTEKENQKTMQANRRKIDADAEKARIESAAIAYDTYLSATRGVRRNDTGLSNSLLGLPQVVSDMLRRFSGQPAVSDGFASRLDKYLPYRKN
ncbi:DNA pilot protein [Dipodfec virus UOA04_Rod_1057]|nr:DNA pilot protein [Dipodfec virus UOA04_Rod_1057]